MAESNETNLKKSKKKVFFRIGLLLALATTLFLVSKIPEVRSLMQLDVIRGKIENAGNSAGLILLLIFIVGTIMNIPGMLMMALALLVFGAYKGGIYCYLGTNIALNVNFVFLRLVGGKSLQHVENRYIQKWLHRLDKKPIKAVVVLRIIFGMIPPLNTALALSNIRIWHHTLGSAIGMIMPVITLSVIFHFFNDYFLQLIDKF